MKGFKKAMVAAKKGVFPTAPKFKPKAKTGQPLHTQIALGKKPSRVVTTKGKK